MALKTDYKNDVLDTSVNTNRKYQQTTNSDGTISLTDVTVYSQEGSLLGASDINATNTRVNQLTASDGLDFKFATDGEGNYGYLGADDSFIPFKSGVGEPIVLVNAKTANVVNSLTLDKDYTCISVLMCQTNGNVTHMFYNGEIHYANSDYLLATSKRAGIHVFTNCKQGDVLKPTNNTTYSIWSVIACE